MNIKRLLALAGLLTESSEYTPDMEAEVERRIADLPAEMQSLILDAVEIARAQGEGGIPSQLWSDKLHDMHPEKTFRSAEVFSNVMRRLDCCMKSVNGMDGKKRYVFSPRATTNADFEIENNASAHAIRQQIGLADEVMRAVNSMGSFTMEELIRLIRYIGLPLSTAETYADHFVGQFMGSVLRKEGDRYFVIERSRPSLADTMARFRDMAANPPKTNSEE